MQRDKMQLFSKNTTKCNRDKMQPRQNATTTKCNHDKVQLRKMATSEGVESFVKGLNLSKGLCWAKKSCG